MRIEDHIAERVKELRKQHSYSQSKFSAKAGMSLRLLQDIEYGKAQLTVRALKKLSDALQLPIGELFKGYDFYPSDAGESVTLIPGESLSP